MKARVAAVLLAWLVSASLAEAGLFHRTEDHPKPVDTPMLRPNVQESHKPGNRAHHPAKYQGPQWGAQWKHIFRPNHGPFTPIYLRN